MKRELIYRPEALADLDEVESYTKQTWGAEQAKRYAAAMVADIKALRTSALRHPIYNDVYPGLRRKRSGMHHIYYLVSSEYVEVLNIIHVQRDPGLHLKVETWENNK
jgi:toxin ParE1/3/4